MKVNLEVKDMKEFQKWIREQVENVVRRIVKEDFVAFIKKAVGDFASVERLTSMFQNQFEGAMLRVLQDAPMDGLRRKPNTWGVESFSEKIKELAKELTVRRVNELIDDKIKAEFAKVVAKGLTPLELDTRADAILERILREHLKKRL